MKRRSEGDDLQVIGFESNQPERRTRASDRPAPHSHPDGAPRPPAGSPPPAGRPGRRRRGAIVAVALVVLARLVVIGWVAVSGRSRPAVHNPPAHPTIEEVNTRASVWGSAIVSVWGSKILARPVTETNGIGPMGLIDPTPGAGRTRIVAVSGSSILVQGSDAGGDGRTGTWAYPTQTERHPVFLGTSTGFCPSFDGQAWLTDGTTVRHVATADAAMLDGPYRLDGQLVASVGAGLLLQRGPTVVWWLPGPPGETRVVGTGTALDGLGEYIVWQAPDGRIKVTDPNTGHTTATSVALRPGQAVGAAPLSPSFDRLAAVVGTEAIVGDAFQPGRRIAALVGPVTDVAWLDDNTLLARIGDRGVVAIDATTGVVVHEPDLGYASLGLAILRPALR
jgi:hypothetical protein